MKMRLEITNPSGSSRDWEQSGSIALIGRDPSCQLAFDDREGSHVSGRHARVELGAQGASLTDLGSSNGTFLNGRKIDGTVPLKTGDQISLGQWGPKLRVASIEAAQATVRAPVLPPSPPPASPSPHRTSPFTVNQPGLAPPPPPIPSSPIPHIPTPPMPLPPSLSDSHPKANPATLYQDPSASQGRTIAIVASAAVGLVVLVAGLGLALRKPGSNVSVGARYSQPQIYDRTLQSAVWVTSGAETPLGFVSQFQGSGSIVDRNRRLILTNQHVVDDRKAVYVYFPHKDGSGQIVTDREIYRNNRATLGKYGKVIATDPVRDLALIEVIDLPAESKALPLASASASPGERIYTVGNPAASGALWVFTAGDVRAVYQFHDDVWHVQSNMAINGGDSGGPVVNERCELVAVNVSKRIGGDVNLVTHAIDIREVKRFLKEKAPQ